MLEPYNWTGLTLALQHQFEDDAAAEREMFIAIDGLDEHWDASDASLYFLAQLLSVGKDFTAKFGASTHILICLRDNISGRLSTRRVSNTTRLNHWPSTSSGIAARCSS